MKTPSRPAVAKPHPGNLARPGRPHPRGPQGTASMAKTMELLDLIGLADQPPTFTDLASSSRLPRGTLHRLLAALSGDAIVYIDKV